MNKVIKRNTSYLLLLLLTFFTSLLFAFNAVTENLSAFNLVFLTFAFFFLFLTLFYFTDTERIHINVHDHFQRRSILIDFIALIVSGWIVFAFKDSHHAYAVNTLLFVFLFLLLSSALESSKNVQVHSISQRPSNKEFKIFNLFVWIGLILSNALAFFRYYPGLMMTDSVWQWQQLKTDVYSNWHPVIDTLIMKACVSIWNTPAAYAVLQILVSISVLAFMLTYFFKQCDKVETKVAVYFIGAFVMIFPLFSIMNQFITKDSLFSSLFLLEAFLIYRILTDPTILKKKVWLLGIGITSFLFATLRSNTFIALVVFEALFLIFKHKKQYRNWHIVIIAVILLKMIITGPVYNQLNVQKSDSSESFATPTQIIAAVYDANGKITSSQRKEILRILPDDQWRTLYNPAYVDSIKFSPGTQYNREYIRNNLPKLTLLTTQLIVQNPKTALKGYYLQTKAFWKANTKITRFFDDRATNLYSVSSYIGVKPSGKKYRVPGWSYSNYWASSKTYQQSYDKVTSLFYKFVIQLLLSPAGILIFSLILFLVTLLSNTKDVIFYQLLQFLTWGTLIVGIPASQLRYFTPFYLNIILLWLIFVNRDSDVSNDN